MRDIEVFQLAQRLQHLGLQADQIVGGEVHVAQTGVGVEEVGLKRHDVHAGQ